ncbi:hypothetical protein [Candidatus Protochlamydia phocaeensis]|uniref:hypothetical protein n=1 Tax=Candidatus Protochlamydia phocaeensis TaxID=1414722 RepID=UPI000837D330|nr:hypothetical protein [Candidatus Protochlamydia phocaeensis]
MCNPNDLRPLPAYRPTTTYSRLEDEEEPASRATVYNPALNQSARKAKHTFPTVLPVSQSPLPGLPPVMPQRHFVPVQHSVGITTNPPVPTFQPPGPPTAHTVQPIAYRNGGENDNSDPLLFSLAKNRK